MNIDRYYATGYLMYTIFVLALFLVTFTHFVSPFFVHIPLLLAFVPICWKAIADIRHKKIGTELFLVFATIIALIGDQETAMTVILLIMLFAEYLSNLITQRTEHAIAGLIKLIPQNITIQVNHQEQQITAQELKVGMHVVVKTGGRIPVDGVVIQGSAAINEASLTGESVLKEKHQQARVYAGTIVESGALVIRAEKVREDTFFGKIVALVEHAEEKKAHVSLLADKIAWYLVPSLLLFIGLVWLVTSNLNLVMTLLVFGSPLELTLITPLAILAGIIAAFRNGVLVKGGLVLEKFAKSDTIIFDKTGTLTLGEPHITDIEVFNKSYTQKDILTIAAIAEKYSDHVSAKAILKKAHEEGIFLADPEDYVSISGHGVCIRYNNKHCFVGNKHFLEASEHGNIQIPEHAARVLADQSSFYVGCDGVLYGKIYMADTIRPQAKETIYRLQREGFKQLVLLSGDQKHIAQQVGAELGIATSYGEVFPDQKLQLIEKFQNQGHIVTMVGDGINDAPALKQADIGIAMGAMGMEPAIDAADIVLITNDLSKIVFVHALSKKIFKVIQQNIFLGFFTIHAFGFLLAFLQAITPVQAALFHAIPDLAILLNSARLANFKFTQHQN